MKKNTLLALVIMAITASGCKKEMCYSCRACDVRGVFAKGTDTIIIEGDAYPLGILDTSYTHLGSSLVWHNFDITFCRASMGLYHFFPDSCREIPQ